MKQIKKTLIILRRSPYQALAAALAMTLTFFVASVFVVLIVGGQIILNYIEQRPQVIGFFKDTTSETKILELKRQIESSGLTKDVRYVTKEEALEIYRERNKEEPLLLESVSADFLPASLDISITKATDVPEITRSLKESAEIERVIAPENLVEQLIKWTNAIRLGGLIFVSILTIISVLIIIMVIGMRIALRQEEIAIMGLVGATKSYIAKPFLIEGAIYGVIGATIAIFLVYVPLLLYSRNIQEYLGPIQVFPINPLFFIYLWVSEALAAAVVGVAGAGIALYRYLKIK